MSRPRYGALDVLTCKQDSVRGAATEERTRLLTNRAWSGRGRQGFQEEVTLSKALKRQGGEGEGETGAWQDPGRGSNKCEGVD